MKEEPRETEGRYAAGRSAGRSPVRDGARARGAWWKVLLAGLALYLVALGLLAASARPALVPTVLVLGAFLPPVSFAVFLHERDALAGVSPAVLALTFLAGGALGRITAQVLEPGLITPTPSLPAALAAGFGEEAAKMVAISWLLGRREYCSMMHGVLFGAASGAGLAAFESMGYAFNLLQTRGDAVLMGEALLARGALSPLIHGTWAAISAGVLWRERRGGRLHVSAPVVGAFFGVVTLHGLWEWTIGAVPLAVTLPGLRLQAWPVEVRVPEVSLPGPAILIGLISLWILARLLRRGSR